MKTNINVISVINYVQQADGTYTKFDAKVARDRFTLEETVISSVEVENGLSQEEVFRKLKEEDIIES